jgi:hypothetical protein
MSNSIKILLITLLLFSCSNGKFDNNRTANETNIEKDMARIIGEWSVVKWVSNGKNLDVTHDRGLSIIFNENGTHITIVHVVGEPDEEISKESWKIHNGDSIYFNSEHLSKYKYSFSSDTLILEGSFNGEHDVVYHVRKNK